MKGRRRFSRGRSTWRPRTRHPVPHPNTSNKCPYPLSRSADMLTACVLPPASLFGHRHKMNRRAGFPARLSPGDAPLCEFALNVALRVPLAMITTVVGTLGQPNASCAWCTILIPKRNVQKYCLSCGKSTGRASLLYHSLDIHPQFSTVTLSARDAFQL